MTATAIHTVYRLQSQDRVPSVTTILGVLAKPALIHWAWEQGVAGQDYRKVRDAAGDIGTLAHYLIMSHLRGEKPDTSGYSPAALDTAETCLLKYWDWEKEHKVEPVLVEQSLVSEVYHFGGTIDLLARVDGQLALVDYKTGKGLYAEHFHQLAAYQALLAEAGHDLTACRILRIGRDPSEGFEERMMGNLSLHWEIFLACLQIYELQGRIRKGEKA